MDKHIKITQGDKSEVITVNKAGKETVYNLVQKAIKDATFDCSEPNTEFTLLEDKSKR